MLSVILCKRKKMMTEKDIKAIHALFDESARTPKTKEEALFLLRNAGILDENGEHTEPYKHLGMAVKRFNEQKAKCTK